LYFVKVVGVFYFRAPLAAETADQLTRWGDLSQGHVGVS
jgi:hypothetical protein